MPVGRRLLALALGSAAVALTCAGTASADANGGEQITATVYGAGQLTTDSVSLADLVANCPNYTGTAPAQYLSGGTPTPGQTVGTNSWTLPEVLGCLRVPIAPGAITAITVLGNNGIPQESPAAQLSRADLSVPSDFANPSELPIISDDGSGIEYLRPWRGGSDGNASDQVQVAAPASLSLEVFEGRPLHVDVRASASNVSVGEKVRFSATVAGARGGRLAYRWMLPDGLGGSSAAAPQAAFADAGSYDVTVQVIDAAGGAGVGSVTVTVGAQTPAGTGAHSRSGGGNSTRSNSPTGPDRSSGSHTGSRAGTSHGGSTPGRHTTTSAATPQPSHATAGRAAPARVRAPARGTSRAAVRPRAAARPRAPVRPGSHAPAPAIRASLSTPLVAGRLIADVTPLPSTSSPLVREVPATTAAAPPLRRALSASPLPALASGLVILLVFSLGARRELRGRRNWPAAPSGR